MYAHQSLDTDMDRNFPEFSAGVGDGVALKGIGDLPGPIALPFIGNLLQLRPERFHQIVEGWSRRYGDYFRLKVGPIKVFAIADANTIGALLRDRPDGFSRGSKLEKIGAEMGISGLFTSNGEAWQRQRPMIMSALDPAHIRSYFPSLIEVTHRLMKRWRVAAERGESIDLQADLMRYTVDVTAGLAFGISMNTLESSDHVIQEHLDSIFPMIAQRMFSPIAYWRFIAFPRDRRLKEHLARVHEAVADFIAQARARMACDPSLRDHPRNLIEAMIGAPDSGRAELNDRDVAGNILTLLLAGEDTTANTLAWMIHLLYENPRALGTAQAEVDAMVDGEVPTVLEQTSRLDYVEACAHEAMRLKPVAPILFLQAQRESVVAGVTVPKNTMLLLLLRRVATDARNFSRPVEFDPQRWLLDQKTPSTVTESPRRVSMPFGAGPRLCPGRYLALLEIKMVIAMLLRNFKVECVFTRDGRPVRERLAFTMEPVGLRLRLKARSDIWPHCKTDIEQQPQVSPQSP